MPLQITAPGLTPSASSTTRNSDLGKKDIFL